MKNITTRSPSPTEARALACAASLVVLFTGVAEAMDKFTRLKEIAEEIAINRITDPGELSRLLDGSFMQSDDSMPYHVVYEGRMNAGSLFDSCELRLPKSAEATSAVISCGVEADSELNSNKVLDAYGDHASFEPPSPRAPETAPAYISVDNGNVEISYGYQNNSGLLKRIVIDIRG